MITLLDHADIAAAYLIGAMAIFVACVAILYAIDLRWHIIDPFHSARSQLWRRLSRFMPPHRPGR